MNEGQKQVWVGLERHFNSNEKPVAWFHSASLGEFEQGKGVSIHKAFEDLQKKYDLPN